MGLTRRQLLRAMGLSAIGAVVFAGCSVPERKWVVQSPNKLPEDLVTGTDNWYATLSPSTGEGIIVRVVEGRAKKVEGNPDYPVNRGKSSARAQAELQALYHPDRIRNPLSRPSRQAAFAPTDWEAGLNEVTSRLKALSGQPDTVVLITEPLRGHLALIVDRFVKAYGATHLTLESLEETNFREASRAVFVAFDGKPFFDIARAEYVVSFGADFLGGWHSPTQYGIAYGEFRQGPGRKRGHLVQIEPRFSLTAANADEWVPIRPGTEGYMALSIAYVLVNEGLGDPAGRAVLQDGVAALEPFRPEEAAKVIGIPAERIQEIARELGQSPAPLVLGGGLAGASTNGRWNLTAILSLNWLLGNVFKPGGVLLTRPDMTLEDLPYAERATPLKQWEETAYRMRGVGGRKPVDLVLVHGADPVHGLPGNLKFGEALARVPYIASFSSFMDDTTARADLVLPDHAPLEAWGDDVANPSPPPLGADASAPFVTWGVQQPVVKPMYDTFGFGDALLAIAEELGGEPRARLPWRSVKEALQDRARVLHRLGIGSISAPDFDSFWNALLQRGGWWDNSLNVQGQRQSLRLRTDPRPPKFAGQEAAYPYHLIVFPSQVGDGRDAHLPWLQSQPDPLTSVAWQTWVELNPHTAEALGVVEGDIVEVESMFGKIEASVYVHPAAPPDIVSIPVGQGHAAYGRYAGGRGANVMSILAPLTDDESGAFAYAATRVKLTKTGKHNRITKYEGSVPPIQDPHHPVVQITGPA